ncbi:uncharacterized protein LOC111029406 [Myzus persicae]|uniref:uncharacterized protein LOC111029406 n=1 Tax=Myzus persicae TaxID=13164 RepID=UPI000B935180|nr:uncharacterized protein LOC111029406 [Myzus persicae]
MSLTGRSSNTVCDWMNLCRDIPLKMFEKRNKFGRPDVIIQVDECLLRGSRKNHKGRYRLADLPSENIEDEHGKRNYGRRMDGPWVFGLCDYSEARYFVVEKRDKQTLHDNMTLLKERLYWVLLHTLMDGQGIMGSPTMVLRIIQLTTAKILLIH